MHAASRLARILLVIGLGCAVNPVTGKNELRLISEAQEIRLGEQQYAPTQQSEGGDFDALPELTRYVSEVGQKLAAVSDRKLPYEFVVLDNSVPNAWALPGGKIAVNRGLLTELENEAELAAVLGHEIVHAAARHGAKAQERGTLMQAGLAVAQMGAMMGGVDPDVAGLLLQGAGVGAQLVHTKYGRDAELESDLYGTRYMKKAGYDPTGAVTLQEAFVRLANGRHQDWLTGLFASHPPSAERVAKNKETAAALGAGGELGEQRYAQQIAPLARMKPAYEKYDRALEAAQQDDVATARALAREAIAELPRAGQFHQLLGDLALAEDEPRDALVHYAKAIEWNPDYFGSYLGAGIAEYEVGDHADAERWLTQSAELLPTAPAAYYLGNIHRDRGDTETALRLYQAAAGSQSRFGQMAAAELVQIDLPRNPSGYIAAGGQLDARGRVVLVVENRAPVAVAEVRVTPVLLDDRGRAHDAAPPILIQQVLAPGERVAGDAGIGTVNPDQAARLRFRVDGARVAEQRR